MRCYYFVFVLIGIFYSCNSNVGPFLNEEQSQVYDDALPDSIRLVYAHEALQKISENREVEQWIALYLLIGNLSHDSVKCKFYQVAKSKALEQGLLAQAALASHKIALAKRRSYNYELAVSEGNKALAMAEQLVDSLAMIKYNNSLGVTYLNKESYDTAILYFQKALALSQATNDSLRMAYSYNNLGITYGRNRQYGYAIVNYRCAENIWSGLDNPEKRGLLLKNMAIRYNNLGEFAEAYSSLLEARELFTDTLSEDYGKLINVFGVTELKLSKVQEAKAHFIQALEIANAAGSLTSQSIALANLAECLEKERKYDSALFCLNAAIGIDKRIESRRYLTADYVNVAGIYSRIGEFVKAKPFLDSALFLVKKYELGRVSPAAKLAMGNLLLMINGPETSEKWLVAEDINIAHLPEMDLVLEYVDLKRKIALAQGDLHQLTIYNRYHGLYKDSLGQKQQIQVQEIQKAYELEQERRTRELINKENALLKAKNRNQQLRNRLLVVMLVAAIMVISLVLYFFLRLRKKNKFIAGLVTDTHHRIRNHLQNVTALLGRQVRLTDDDEVSARISEAQKQVEAICIIHGRLKSEGAYKLVPIEAYFRDLIENNVMIFGQSEEVTANYSISVNVLDVDLATPLGIIVNELVTNSLKHAFDEAADPEISIRFKEVPDGYMLEYTDNGVGLRNAQSKHSHLASHTGHELIHLFMKQLNGEGGLQPGKPKGVYFTLVFPK